MGRASRKRAEQRAAADQRPPGVLERPDGSARVWDLIDRGSVRRPPYRLAPSGAGPALRRLRDLTASRSELDQAIADEVVALVALGTDWGTIGRALGVSRQAARQRYGGISNR